MPKSSQRRQPPPCVSVTFRADPMVPESKLEQTEHGLVPKDEGWYVLNLRDAEWRYADGRGAVCVVSDDFEGRRRESDQHHTPRRNVDAGGARPSKGRNPSSPTTRGETMKY